MFAIILCSIIQKSLGKNTYCDNVTERIQELVPDFNEHHNQPTN
jgi:hypothetical protein